MVSVSDRKPEPDKPVIIIWDESQPYKQAAFGYMSENGYWWLHGEPGDCDAPDYWLEDKTESFWKELDKVRAELVKYKELYTELHERQPEINLNAFSCAVADYENNADELKSENERLNAAYDNIEKHIALEVKENSRLTAENQKLREALEWIQNECYRGPASKQSKKVMDILSKAKEALKEVSYV